jgi:hypothetical protein
MTLRSDAAVASEPGSGVVATAQPRTTLSQRLWDLDWSKVLPWSFDGVTLHAGTFEDALPFMAEHYPRIFGVEPDRFHHEEMTDAKRRFGDEMDVFVFRDGDDRAVGVAAAHPSDWSTYYIRTFAILPGYRENGWCNQWTERICEPLRSVGCDRWEGECSPANSAMLRMLTRQGCLISGSVNSERWGQLIKFAKFLNPHAEAAYRRQYILVPAFGRDAHPKERRTP